MKTFIIDDDEMSIFLTRYYLTYAAFSQDITTFFSAQEALDVMLHRMPENVPQVIFLDLNMPGMDGWEFLEALLPYQQQLVGRCRIYILTSSLDTSDMEHSKEYALVYDFIHKTIDQKDIQTIMASLKENNI